MGKAALDGKLLMDASVHSVHHVWRMQGLGGLEGLQQVVSEHTACAAVT
jgi:hypothetical protein